MTRSLEHVATHTRGHTLITYALTEGGSVNTKAYVLVQGGGRVCSLCVHICIRDGVYYDYKGGGYFITPQRFFESAHNA